MGALCSVADELSVAAARSANGVVFWMLSLDEARLATRLDAELPAAAVSSLRGAGDGAGGGLSSSEGCVDSAAGAGGAGSLVTDATGGGALAVLGLSRSIINVTTLTLTIATAATAKGTCHSLNKCNALFRAASSARLRAATARSRTALGLSEALTSYINTPS